MYLPFKEKQGEANSEDGMAESADAGREGTQEA